MKNKKLDQPYKPHKYFKIPFFYGNEGSIWEILEVVLDKAKILKWLKDHDIAISDTILKTKRLDGKASCSEDKFDKEHTEYNLVLIEAIKNSKIEKIYFTSVKARVKFSHIYTTYIKSLIEQKKEDKHTRKEFIKDGDMSKSGSQFDILEKSYFGRKIHCHILPSPSKRATNLSQGQKKEYYKKYLGK